MTTAKGTTIGLLVAMGIAVAGLACGGEEDDDNPSSVAVGKGDTCGEYGPCQKSPPSSSVYYKCTPSESWVPFVQPWIAECWNANGCTDTPAESIESGIAACAARCGHELSRCQASGLPCVKELSVSGCAVNNVLAAGPRCGDNHCESEAREDCNTCPQDCGMCPPMPTGPRCGDNHCQSEIWEDCNTCPQDCGMCP